MDVKDFAEPLFDAKDWINKTVQNLEQDGSPHTVVNTIIAKLQVYFQQLNADFENTTTNVMQNLPRALHSVDLLAEEATVLKDKMSSVKMEIAKVDQSAGASIASLEKVDKIKTELVSAKKALYEADNWTVLSADIEAVFETGDIDLIAEKLVSMQLSLAALSNASDYDNKKLHLEGLKNRLEALASPFVVEAFSKKSIEQSAKFVKLFTEINRFSQLVNYFTESQKVNLIQQWKSRFELDAEDNTLETFQNYYDFLLQNWEDQLKLCENAMPELSAVNVLLDLYANLLTALSPEFSKIIEKNMKESFEPLQFLLLVKDSSKHFAGLMKINSGSSTSPSKARHLSKAIYLPYLVHFAKYKSYQQETFSNQLTKMLSKETELIDLIQTLGQKNSQVFSLASDALKLCVDLTDGISFPGFLASLEVFFTNYLKLYKTVSVGIIERSKTEQNDFNLFQMCVTVLQNLGSFVSSLKQFDQDCVLAVLSSDNVLKCSETDPFAFSLEIVDPTRKREFSSLVEELTLASEPCTVSSVFSAMEAVCRDVYQASFRVIFAPIATLLDSFSNAPAWKAKAMSSDLPDYSYVPQEYITQIGQYLMNLPQLLEPFLLVENPSLNLALSIAGMEYMQLLSEDVEGGGFVEIFIGRIVDSTCTSYSEQILGINALGPSACKQLITDINYLGNVMEDLGFGLTERLKNISLLLKLSPAEYSTQCAGCPPQLVAAIRQLRNIISE